MGTLLKARAIENMCYCIGQQSGERRQWFMLIQVIPAIYDALGNTINFSNREEIILATLTYDTLSQLRIKLPFYNDSDEFVLIKS